MLGFKGNSAHATLERWLGQPGCRGLLRPVKGRSGQSQVSFEIAEIELKSLILAQIERWRHALHMQVERQRGSNPGGERRTGE